MAVRIYGNRTIKTLPGEATRPTSARVREALFNIWQGQIAGCRWLDICAGSGAMGAEALGRRAAEVVGIEKSGAACRVIEENWQMMAGADQRFEVLKGDALRMLKQLRNSDDKPQAGGFDRIYFDPPYSGELYAPVLNQLAYFLSLQGQAAVEYSAARWQPSELPVDLEIVKEKRYGSTNLIFLRRASASAYR